MSFLSRHKQLLPALLLFALSTWTTARILFIREVSGNSVTTYDFTPAHYLGLSAVACCILSYFIFRKAYRFLLGITLTLGVFSVFNFTLSVHVVNLGLGAVKISFEPVSLCVALLVLALNAQRISQFLRDKSTVHDPNEIKGECEQEVKKFRIRYSASPTEELQKVVGDTRLKPEAIEAAKQLLEERKK